MSNSEQTASGATKPRRGRVWRWAKFVGLILVSTALLYLGSILFRLFRLRAVNPGTTAFMAQRNEAAREHESPPSQQQTWVPFEQISPHLVRAVIAAEDPQFYSHAGLDWGAIRFAIRANLRAHRIVHGASTIDQQLAKNLFFSSSKSFLRKSHEGLVAWEMDKILGKRRVLELYLNVIEWGDGIYGAEAAARHYFNTSAAALDEQQAAFLAALIPNPRSTYNPDLNPERVNYRRDLILASMLREQTPEDVLRSLVVESVMPEFPAQAYAAGAEGAAVARLKLDEQGNITNITILAAPHPAIKETLLAALARWKFKPAKVNDVPTPITSRLTFYYTIENGQGVVRNPLPQ